MKKKAFKFRLLVAALLISMCFPFVSALAGNDPNTDSSKYTDGTFDWKDLVMDVDKTGTISRLSANLWYTPGNPTWIDSSILGVFIVEPENDDFKTNHVDSLMNGFKVPLSNKNLVDQALTKGINKFLYQPLYLPELKQIQLNLDANTLSQLDVTKKYFLYVYTYYGDNSLFKEFTIQSHLTLVPVTVEQYTYMDDPTVQTHKATVHTLGLEGMTFNPDGLTYSGLSVDKDVTGTLDKVKEGITYKLVYKLPAEEPAPATPPVQNFPKTGDQTPIMLYALAAMLAMGGLLLFQKRSRVK